MVACPEFVFESWNTLKMLKVLNISDWSSYIYILFLPFYFSHFNSNLVLTGRILIVSNKAMKCKCAGIMWWILTCICVSFSKCYSNFYVASDRCQSWTPEDLCKNLHFVWFTIIYILTRHNQNNLLTLFQQTTYLSALSDFVSTVGGQRCVWPKIKDWLSTLSAHPPNQNEWVPVSKLLTWAVHFSTFMRLFSYLWDGNASFFYSNVNI